MYESQWALLRKLAQYFDVPKLHFSVNFPPPILRPFKHYESDQSKTETYLERDRNLTRLAEVHVGSNLALIGAVRVFTFFLGVVVNHYFLKISKLAKKAL